MPCSPLPENFHPRVHMKLEIVSRGISKKKEWANHQERSCHYDRAEAKERWERCGNLPFAP